MSGRGLTWREAIEYVVERYRWELDVLREYDRTGRLPNPAEVERLRRRAAGGCSGATR